MKNTSAITAKNKKDLPKKKEMTESRLVICEHANTDRKKCNFCKPHGTPHPRLRSCNLARCTTNKLLTKCIPVTTTKIGKPGNIKYVHEIKHTNGDKNFQKIQKMNKLKDSDKTRLVLEINSLGKYCKDEKSVPCVFRHNIPLSASSGNKFFCFLFGRELETESGPIVLRCEECIKCEL